MSQHATLTIYFSGTDGRIYGGHTQVSLFASYTLGQNISDPETPVSRASEHFKMFFDGCGVTNGLMGGIFGFGLSYQCDSVVERIKTLLEFNMNVVVNVFGLSRGAVAGIILAKSMDELPEKRVSLNLLLFDPVPGNSIASSSWDLFGFTLANQCVDVSESKHVRNVLVLYPHEPLPPVILHAPVISEWPEKCNVMTDVILGKHQGPLWLTTNKYTEYNVAYIYIYLFLNACGTVLDCSGEEIHIDDIEKDTFHGLNEYFKNNAFTYRHTHPWNGADIVSDDEGVYLNKLHKYLVNKYNVLDLLPKMEEKRNEHTKLLRPEYGMRLTYEKGNSDLQTFLTRLKESHGGN